MVEKRIHCFFYGKATQTEMANRIHNGVVIIKVSCRNSMLLRMIL